MFNEGVRNSKNKNIAASTEKKSQKNNRDSKVDKTKETSSGRAIIVRDDPDKLTDELNNITYSDSDSNEISERKITANVPMEAEIVIINDELTEAHKSLSTQWNKNKAIQRVLKEANKSYSDNLDEGIREIETVLKGQEEAIKAMTLFGGGELDRYKQNIVVSYEKLRDIKSTSDNFESIDENFKNNIEIVSANLDKEKDKIINVSVDINKTLELYDYLLKKLSRWKQLQKELTEVEMLSYINNGKSLTENTSGLEKQNNSIIELLQKNNHELNILENKTVVVESSASTHRDILDLLKNSPSKKKDIQQYLAENKDNIDKLQQLKRELKYNIMQLNDARDELIIINNIQTNTDKNWFDKLKPESLTTIQNLEDSQLSLAALITNIDSICEFYNSHETAMQVFSEAIEPVNNLLNKIQEISSRCTKRDVLDKIAVVFMAVLACIFFVLIVKHALPLFLFLIVATVLLGVTAGMLSKSNNDDKQAALSFTKNLTDNLLHDTDDVNKKLVLKQISQALDDKDYYKTIKKFRKLLLDKCNKDINFGDNLEEGQGFFMDHYMTGFLQEIFGFIHKNIPDEDVQKLQDAKKSYLIKMITDPDNSIIEKFIEDITLQDIKDHRQFVEEPIQKETLKDMIAYGLFTYFKTEFPYDEANIRKLSDPNVRKRNI
jgi:hypothetical protein